MIASRDMAKAQKASDKRRRALERNLDTVLDRLASCAVKPRTVEELPGGLTNRNYKVSTPTGIFVVRLCSTQGSLLAIDRANEYLNTVAAAEAGVGAPVVDYLPDDQVFVLRYLQGRTFTDADLATPDNLARVADACRRLHSGPRFANDFNMFDIQLRYLRIVQQHGFRLPSDYLEYMPKVERIRCALAARDEGTVPCNNDLLAANIIDDGRQLWLIDYEYSGNNDPCFELGNIWSEARLAGEQLEQLVGYYYGKHLRNKVARARLLGLMSKYGWTLWASIQDAESTLDFDFWSWGIEKYERAVVEFNDPNFPRLLDEAQRVD